MIKYCNYCKKQHALTKEYWYSLSTQPQCKVYKKDQRARKALDPDWKSARYVKSREWAKNNMDKVREYGRDYYSHNPEKVIQSNLRYTSSRKKVDVEYSLAIRLRQRLNKALRRHSKSGSAVQDLGCSVKEFKVYLESQFREGMSWGNYGRDGWHIDHIVPLSKFSLNDRQDLLKAVHYSNLQPMWAADNIKKSNN